MIVKLARSHRGGDKTTGPRSDARSNISFHCSRFPKDWSTCLNNPLLLVNTYDKNSGCYVYVKKCHQVPLERRTML